MSKRVLCKFFVRGTCLKGEYCGYSHQLRVPPNNICNFYHKGTCTYGDQCKYGHTKEVSEVQPPDLSESDAGVNASVATEISGIGGFEVGESSGCKNMPDNNCNEDDIRSFYPSNQSLSTIDADGGCQLGEECPQLDGDRSEALKLSQQIECSVCLERVLSKTTAEERQFGILSDCDHAFCIMCIRSWRRRFQRLASGGISPTRTCPVCRRFSFFVIPSKVWYTSREEKMEIIDNYKAKLRSIDCKHFDSGNGICPFRTNCFYKHTVQPGSVLWNAAMGQGGYNPRVLELRSHNFNLQDLLARFNNPNPPGESKELENGSLFYKDRVLCGPELQIKDVG